MRKSDRSYSRSVSYAALLAFAALAAPTQGWTQTTSRTAAPEKDEAVVLSPFVVTAEENSGYAATQTLAGTRLKTNLRDLAAAITVVTPEFMQDTAAGTLEELMTYTPSTEIGGAFGNYSAADISSDGSGRADQDAVRRDPQSGGRVRGLQTPNYTRGYFSTSISTDAYNTGSITFSRGANSLLFGLGSAGGVVESTPNQAIIGRNAGSVGFRYGSHESTRSVFDYNFTIIPNRLAVRLDLLDKLDNYQQEPANDRQRRVYAAVTGVLFENKKSRIFGKTMVRASFEAGDGERTPPTSLPPQIGYDPFFSPPPNFQPFTGSDYIAGGGYALLTANWKKWAINDTRRIKVGTSFIPGWYESYDTAVQAGRPDLVSQNYSSSHIFNQLALVFNGSGGATLGAAAPNAALAGFEGWINQQTGQLSFTNPFINTRAYQDGAQNIGFKVPTLHDTKVFDYRNHLLTGGLQNINQRFDAHSVTLEQSFFKNRLGFEATLDKQFYHQDYYQPFGGNSRNVPVYVDTTAYLSDTIPNPNAGRALLINNLDGDQWRNTSRYNRRLTAYLDLDAKDYSKGLGRWLGHHTFTGLYQKEMTELKGLNYGMYWAGEDFNIPLSLNNAAAAAQRNAIQAPTQIIVMSYVSDSLVGVNKDDVRLHPIAMPRIMDGDSYSVSYYDLPTNTYKTGTVTARRLANGGTAGGTDVTSKALAWQMRLANDHIIGLLGWRQDEVETFRQLTTNARAANNEFLDSNLQLNGVAGAVQNGNTFTWNIVGVLPQKYVERLPLAISSVTAHYGVGENFQATSERRDYTNALIPAPSGTTTEFGITIGFKNDKWLLKLNHFDTESLNASVSGAFVTGAVTEVTRALNNYKAVEASTPFTSLKNFADLSAAGYSSYAQLYAAINNLIPAPTRQYYNYEPNATNTAFQLPNGGGIQGLSATTNTNSKGWELELTANPLPNWRISLNAVKVGAVNNNSIRSLSAMIDGYLANMNALKLSNQLEGPASITSFAGRYRNTYINAVSIMRQKDGADNQELRKYRVNLVTNYDFREGILNGFGVGGALRWQSKVAIGYQTYLDSLNNQLLRLDKPYFGPDETNGDVWVSYSRKLTKKIRWKAQLNVRNVIGSQDDIPVGVDPDGSISLYRIAPERAWYLSNTFSF